MVDKLRNVVVMDPNVECKSKGEDVISIDISVASTILATVKPSQFYSYLSHEVN